MIPSRGADEGWSGARGRGPGLVVLAGLVVGVTYGLLTAAPQHVTPEPAPEVVVGDPIQEVRVAYASDVAASGAEDALLASPMLRDPEFLAEVGRWVRFWETTSRRWMPTYLERMTWFEDYVDDVLAEHDLPWSLRYLPVLESGYSPSAVSSASAVGLWQFMEPTAKDHGLEVTRVVDERRDPFKATGAAADFLGELHAEFDSWFLALAAYNAGPDRIRGILRRYAPNSPLSDRLYWDVRRHLPQETRDFVPKYLGAMVVAAHPEQHGYSAPVRRPFEFDRVLVVPQTSLTAVARVAGTSAEEIERLNPEYVAGITPSGRNAYVRIPAGMAESFRQNAAARGGDGAGG